MTASPTLLFSKSSLASKKNFTTSYVAKYWTNKKKNESLKRTRNRNKRAMTHARFLIVARTVRLSLSAKNSRYKGSCPRRFLSWSSIGSVTN